MKAIRIHQHGGLEVLKIDDLPTPKPSHGEALVKIRAVAMNHMDLWVRKGIPGWEIPLPIIPGAEGSGIVESVGLGVRQFKKGDEVIVHPNLSCGRCPACEGGNDHHCPDFGLLGESRNGTEAEFIAVSEKNLLPKPAGLPFEEAAAVPVTFLTAWHMLIDKCRLKAGQTVLVWSAGSGVGQAAIQIAKFFGARVFTTVGSEEKVPKARALGADEVILYKKEDTAKRVKDLTDHLGVDIVFEHVGAATWQTSLKSLAFGGKIVTCGATTGAEVTINLAHLFIKHQQIIGSTMGPSSTLAKIYELAGQGKLKPVIDKVFPFSKVQEAHRRLEGSQQFGKIILIPN